MTTTVERVEAGAVGAATGRLRSLDGLRGVAIIAVLLFHNAWAPGTADWLPGGFLGVDVFFVLSGFLITGILLADHERTGSTLSRRFWYRRTRRLLPAMLLMLTIVAAYAVFRAQPWDLHAIRWRSIATLLYVENWYTIIAHPAPAPVSHAWSLSIEEQWYLVWPFLLGGILVIGRRRRGIVMALLVALALGSALLMWREQAAGELLRAYESTFGRAGELLVGAVLAVFIARRSAWTSARMRRTVEIAGVAGAAWILFCFIATSEREPWMFRGGAYSVAIATAFVILAAIQPTSPVIGTMLSWRPLVGVGLVSYGLYLFHIPIYGWIDHTTTGLDPIALSALRFAVVGAIAVASYFLLEQPFRRGAFAGRGHWLAIGGTMTVAALLLVTTTGARPKATWEVQREAFAKFGRSVPNDTPKLLVAGDGDVLALAFADRPATLTDRVAIAATAAPLCTIAGRRPVVGDEVAPPPKCDPWIDTFRAGTAFEPDAVVLMAGTGALRDQRVGDRTLRVGDADYAQLLTRRLDRARSTLVGDDGRLIVTNVPCIGLATTDRSPTATALRDPARRAWANGVWRRWVDAQGPRVIWVDLDPVLCSPTTGDPARPVRAPDGALTRAGLDALRTRLVAASGLAGR